MTSVRVDSDAVGLDMIGAVTSTREKEKNDADLKSFEEMLKEKKKKKKQKKIENPDTTDEPIDTTVNNDNTENTTIRHNVDITLNHTNEDDDEKKNVNDDEQININNHHKDGEKDHEIDIADDEFYLKDEMNTNYFSSTDDREYPYTNLLDRIYHQLNEKNPNCFEQKSHKLPPPQTHLIGSKKTGWGNFNNICQKLGRKPDHVKQFFLAEMNTTGNLDGDGNLILKGRWRPKQFESLLKKYIREYIECQNCHSPITTLTKDNTTRLLFLTCTVCKSQRSVAPIKAGFHAVSKDDRRQAKKHAH